MTVNNRDQVELFKLIFTLNWEDPESDHRALSIQPGETVMSITSGACNTLGFLLHDPGSVLTVDINPSQSYLLEMKMAAIGHLNFKEFTQFLGLYPATDRLDKYRILRSSLSAGAIDFWDRNSQLVKEGFLLKGRYENFVKMVGRLISLIQGKKRVDGLFVGRDLEQQREFYRKAWDIRRTRLIFELFFNKHILAKRGLKADYFHFDDGSTSFAESFFRKFKRVVHDIPITGNYFLYVYLKGRYRSPEEMPAYLLETNFETLKERLDRIRIFTADAKAWLAELPPDSIDCFALSNICELMSLEDTARTFEQVLRTARRGARLCFRNLMIPRSVPDHLQDVIIRNEELSEELLSRDRSFVYSRVDALYVNK